MAYRRYFKLIFGTVLLYSMAATSSPAQETAANDPVVYNNQYITVRSSIKNMEYETFHLGDVLTLSINLEYASGVVRIVNLDETLLRQSWDELPGIIFRDGPQIFRESSDADRTRIKAVYSFQLVACSGGVDPPCPGGKVFPLPDLNLGMELMSDDGRVISNTEVNFRPWPGYVALSSALPLREGSLEPFVFYFPRRAFGLPVPIDVSRFPALLLLFAGILTVGGTVLAPAARTWMRRRVPSRIGFLGTRWERIIDRLQDEKLKEEEFWEGVRVAVSWYCFDTFDVSTLQWTENNDGQESEDEELGRLKAIYLEAINPKEVSSERRREVLNILAEISKQD